MASSKHLRSLRNIQDLHDVLSGYIICEDLGKLSIFVINYGPQLLHKGAEYCRTVMDFISGSDYITESDKCIIQNLKQYEAMSRKVNTKGRKNKEFVAPMLTVQTVPKRKQHHCVVDGCKSMKFFAFQCCFGAQCQMKLDPKLHQEVPFFVRWIDSRETACAFCARAYLNPLYKVASNTYNKIRSVIPHTDYYLSIHLPAPGRKIKCCNKFCSSQSCDYFVLSLSCLSPSETWHAYCNECKLLQLTEQGECESCSFDWKAPNDYYSILLD